MKVFELTDALETLNCQMNGVADVMEVSSVDEESLVNLVASLESLIENANESVAAAKLLNKRRQMDPDNVSFFGVIIYV